VKTSIIKNLPGPFDPIFGTSGGEDTQLFTRVRDNGAKLINCYEAITYEYVSPERTKVKWLLKRAFRLGNNFAIRSIELSAKNKTLIRLKHALISSVYFFLSLLISIILFPVRDKWFNLILKASSNAGKFAAVFGIRASEYK
jgi:succinoglycan biosynthesis protein ExoM